jgi:hypothetical protein
MRRSLDFKSRARSESIRTQRVMAHSDVWYRIAALDEEMGIVLFRLYFGNTNSYGLGSALTLFEAFKIYGGQIHAVEAFMDIMPENTSYGFLIIANGPIQPAFPPEGRPSASGTTLGQPSDAIVGTLSPERSKTGYLLDAIDWAVVLFGNDRQIYVRSTIDMVIYRLESQNPFCVFPDMIARIHAGQKQ